MSQQQALRLKAEAFDRIVRLYQSLVDDAGFYSKNWVVLAEMIEAEIRKVREETGEWTGKNSGTG